jgi:hypothetical protein
MTAKNSLQKKVNGSNGLLKKSMKAGCSIMVGCKVCAVSDTCLQAIMRNEAYFPYAAVKHDERNAADGPFSTACQHIVFYCSHYSFHGVLSAWSKA